MDKLTIGYTLTERNEKMEIRKILLSLITISLFCSCSTSKISPSEISKINGVYSGNTIENNEVNFSHYNFVSLLNRKLIKDTLWGKPIFYYKFKLEILDKKHIEISVINETNNVITKKKYNYRREEETIILKNKNTQLLLIPYLAGALDVTKLRIKCDEDRNLNIVINQHRSGGAFMIPMGWSNTEIIKKYKRIE